MEKLFLTTTIVIFVILLLLIMLMFVKISKMISTMNEMTNMMYYILKKQKSIDYILDKVSVSNSNTELELSALSTSIDSMFNEYKKSINAKIYPTPQLADMITTTIKEQVAVEMVLTRNLRIVNKDTVNVIIENTIKTYPHVDESYIIKKVLSIIENLKTNNNQSE